MGPETITCRHRTLDIKDNFLAHEALGKERSGDGLEADVCCTVGWGKMRQPSIRVKNAALTHKTNAPLGALLKPH